MPSENRDLVQSGRGSGAKSAFAEAVPFRRASAEHRGWQPWFDTLIFNGTPSYIRDLEKALQEAARVLRPGGRVVVADVPAESSYGLLYMLAAARGSWRDPRLQALAPEFPAAVGNWRTTEEKERLLHKVGFVDLEFAQTLTRHPRFSNEGVEQPVEGYDRGDYMAIRARKPSSA